MRIDLRQVRHVLALDRYRNFARAAESVGLTQPALSRSLQALEDEIGARLFDRDRSGVEPTAVGARLIELSGPLMEQSRALEHGVRQALGLSTGLLRVGAGPYAAEVSAGAAVGRLVSDHPGLQVDLAVDDWPALLKRVLAGDLDLAVFETSELMDDERLTVEPLPGHACVAFGRWGHPLVARANLTLEQIRDYPLVLTSLPERIKVSIAASRGHPRRGEDGENALPDIHVTTASLVRSVVLASDAVGFALPAQLRDDLHWQRVAVLPLSLPWMKTAYGIVRLAGRTPSPAASEYMRHLREIEAELDGP